MSARNSRTVKAARRAERARGAAVDMPAVWDGLVSQAAIARVVGEVVEACAPLLGPPGPGLCWAYAAAGAMMAVLATGERHAIQMGSYAVRDTAGEVVYGYGRGYSVAIFSGLEDFLYHSWFTRVPAGAAAEMAWAVPPWVQVADLSPPGPRTRKAVADRGGELLPDWFWQTRTGVRDRFGVTYSPDRALTLRRLDGILSLVHAGLHYLTEWLELVCEVAARRLGLSMDGWVPLVPGSFMVGHRS